MKPRQFTFEDLLYVFLFLAGLSLRMLNLGNLSLNNYEAFWALQALSVARGAPSLLGSQPLYVNITGLLFYIFGSSEYVARFLPAFIGSLIVLPAYLLRDKLGRLSALFLAFVLVFDPILLASSRQADSLGMAVVFVTLSLAFLLAKKPNAMGVLLGLAFLCGTQIWLGALSLILALLATRFFLIEEPSKEVSPDDAAMLPGLWPSSVEFIKQNKIKIILWSVVTIIFGGTLFWVVPTGLGAALSSPVFIGQNSVAPYVGNNASVSISLMGLLTYEPLLLLLSVLGIIRVLLRRDKPGLFFCFWWIFAFILYLIYPARTMNDLVWVCIPLWVISARFFTWIVTLVELENKKWFAGFVTLTLVLLVFISMTLVYLVLFFNTQGSVSDQNEMIKRVAIVVGGGALLLTMTYLIGFGWSAKLASTELLVGLSLFLGVITFSSGWSAAGLNKNPDQEMWRYSVYPTSEQLLEKTVDEFSRWKLGASKLLDVVVVNVDTPAMRWMLRDQREVYFANNLPAGNTPSLIISPVNNELSVTSTYRGTAFVIGQEPSWTLMFSQEWINWALFRKAPLSRDTVVLWARNDLFPEGGVLPQTIKIQ